MRYISSVIIRTAGIQIMTRLFVEALDILEQMLLSLYP